jgi:hypothetical protein
MDNAAGHALTRRWLIEQAGRFSSDARLPPEVQNGRVRESMEGGSRHAPPLSRGERPVGRPSGRLAESAPYLTSQPTSGMNWLLFVLSLRGGPVGRYRASFCARSLVS